MVTLGWMYLAEPNDLYFSILIPFVTHVSDTHKTAILRYTCNATNNQGKDKGVLKLVWKNECKLCRLDRLLSAVTFGAHNCVKFGSMTDRQASKQFHSFIDLSFQNSISFCCENNSAIIKGSIGKA
jgi:hypothetical protein